VTYLLAGLLLASPAGSASLVHYFSFYNVMVITYMSENVPDPVVLSMLIAFNRLSTGISTSLLVIFCF